ncbi:Pns1p [Sporobolomyces salmoneus]|uniref:Pns1p n=1 Tax=Sporobolomyces salmoneus TaxID=183962 RepID=UPI00318034D5
MSNPYPPPNSYQPNGYYAQDPMPQQQMNYAQPPPQQYQQQYQGNGNGYGNGYNTGGYDQQQMYQNQQQVAAGMGKNEQQAYQPQPAGMQGKFEDVKPKWNDLIFALLFLAQLGAFIAIAVISLRALPASEGTGGLGNPGGSAVTLNSSVAWLLSIICGAALVFSIILLVIVRLFTKVILEITLLLSVVLSVAYAVYLWVEKYWSGAIIFTIFAVFSIIAYPGMRRRIPLSKQLLLFVLKIAKHNKSVYVIALAGTILQTMYAVFWSISVVGIYQKWSPNASGSGTSGGNASSGALIGIMVFAVFNFYYTSQFIINLFLTVEAGIFGTYYYSGPGATKVAFGAFKRASTYSFGSIAFGSLIVAILDVLRAFFQILRSYENSEGNMIGAAIACVAQCCIGCIASLVEYFNRYAYIQIALFGKSYIKAAKDTWNLFKDRGITALINDCLVNNIWTFGSYAVGALCSAFAFIYLKVLDPSFIEQNSSLKAVVMGYAFLTGFTICHTLGYGALSSGVSTVFVCLAENPEILAERDPALFGLIQQAYPQVVTSV